MVRLVESLWQDHQDLRAQMGAFSEVLNTPLLPEDRREILWHLLQTLGPYLEYHIHREEMLFPSFQRSLGRENNTLALLQDEYAELRLVLKRLTDLVVRPEGSSWSQINETTQLLMDLMEDHEKWEQQLIMEVEEATASA